MKIYQIDSSARKEGSSSRALAKKLLDKIKKPGDEVIYRDLDDDMLFVSGLTESGMKIDEKDQTEDHKKMFELSDKLVKELKESDVIIISAPIYNYGPPATLKAWCDLAARIGETFRIIFFITNLFKKIKNNVVCLNRGIHLLLIANTNRIRSTSFTISPSCTN